MSVVSAVIWIVALLTFNQNKNYYNAVLKKTLCPEYWGKKPVVTEVLVS